MNLQELQTSNSQNHGEFSRDRHFDWGRRVKEELDGHSDYLTFHKTLSAGWHPLLCGTHLRSKWELHSGEKKNIFKSTQSGLMD